MTDQHDNLERGSLEGEGLQPTDQTSQGSDKQTSVDVQAELKSLKESNERLAKMVASMQSGKDKGIRDANKRLDNFDERFTRVEELVRGGMTKDAAIQQMNDEEEIKEILNLHREGRLGISESKEVGTSGDTEGSDLDVDAYLKSIGVDPKGPEAQELYKSGDITPEGLVKFQMSRATKSKEPSEGQMMGTGGGTTPTTDLYQQYRKEIDAPGLTVDQKHKIRLKYRAQKVTDPNGVPL